MSFLKVDPEVIKADYVKVIVREELLPRCFYLDSEWANLIAEAEYMGEGVRYIDSRLLPKIPPMTNFFKK